MEEKRNQQKELLDKMRTQLDGFECYARQLMDLGCATPVIADRINEAFEISIRRTRKNMDRFERFCIK